jgi:hypothetical protein
MPEFAPMLIRLRDIIDAAQGDAFDVPAYFAFALKPLTRAERVETRKPTIMPLYDAKLRGFVDFVLQHYVARASTNSIPASPWVCWNSNTIQRRMQLPHWQT